MGCWLLSVSHTMKTLVGAISSCSLKSKPLGALADAISSESLKSLKSSISSCSLKSKPHDTLVDAISPESLKCKRHDAFF